MRISYKMAWYIVSAARVTALAAAGFNFFLIIYQTDAQVDAALAAIPFGGMGVVLLNGDDTAKETQVTRLKDYGSVYGFLITDEANLVPEPTIKQMSDYNAVKVIAPSKYVFASYHIEPTGVRNPESVVREGGKAYDYVFLNFYPCTWGRSDKEAGAALESACAAARAFFPGTCPIIPMEQAAGCTSDTPGRCRPINGLLQAQHNIWVAAGLMPLGAVGWYGDATNPENENLSSSSALLAEASAVS